MSDLLILVGLFVFVMAGVTAAGWVFWSGPSVANESGTSVIGEPRMHGTQEFFAQAFRRVGETVPAATAASNPMRSLLMSAGYRYPSAVPILYGIKCALALFFGVLLGPAAQWLLACEPCRVLGRLSFSIYLLHFPILFTVGCAGFVALAGALAYPVAVAVTFAGFALVVLIAAAGFEYWIDRPAIRLSRHLDGARTVLAVAAAGRDTGR